MSSHTQEWIGALDRAVYSARFVAQIDAIADAARDGNWGQVFRLLTAADYPSIQINVWRIGGMSWFTPLHQAAWHGAPESVVAEMLHRVKPLGVV